MVEILHLTFSEVIPAIQRLAGAAAVITKKRFLLEKTVPNWLERLETQGFGRRLG